MSRVTAPFRADHVGSLLRPAAIKDARAKHERGELSDRALREIEDKHIQLAIRRQEDIGLKSVTDGELRRSNFFYDFFAHLDGVESYMWEGGLRFQGIESRLKAVKVVGKLGFSRHPMTADFRFLRANAHATPKLAIAPPSLLLPFSASQRDILNAAAYPDLSLFYDDLTEVYKKAVHAFFEAGCRYLQIDEVSIAGVVADPARRQQLKERGTNPDELLKLYFSIINAALIGRPADMVVAVHTCHGNYRSSFLGAGGYEPVADLLFNTLDVDAFFLEYDTERSGGFEPLRFVPKGKCVVLGLLSSKFGALEDKDAIKRRIDEAARYIDIGQLCLSPQCGFASSEEGNVLSEDQQWRKLALVKEIADEVWGDS